MFRSNLIHKYTHVLVNMYTVDKTVWLYVLGKVKEDMTGYFKL